MDSPFACIKARQETSRNRNSFILQPCLRKQTTNQVFLELLLRVVLSNNCLPLPLKFPSEELSPLVRHGFLKLSAKLEHPQWKLTFLPPSSDYVCAKCANGRKKGSKIKQCTDSVSQRCAGCQRKRPFFLIALTSLFLCLSFSREKKNNSGSWGVSLSFRSLSNEYVAFHFQYIQTFR